MSKRKDKRRVMRTFKDHIHEPLLWRLPQEREWLAMTPVGREFGSKDFERLNVLDMFGRGEISEEQAMALLDVDQPRLAAMLKTDGLPHRGRHPVKKAKHMHEPPHPGAVLREYLGDNTITSLAGSLGVHRATLSRIVNGSAGISPQMSLRLGAALGCAPDFWAGLQLKYDVSQANLLMGKKVAKTVRRHRRKR